jgi:hypothetical protein
MSAHCSCRPTNSSSICICTYTICWVSGKKRFTHNTDTFSRTFFFIVVLCRILWIVNGGQILYTGADLHGSYSLCAASYDIHIDLRKVKENCLRETREAFRSMGTTTQFVLAGALMQEVICKLRFLWWYSVQM